MVVNRVRPDSMTDAAALQWMERARKDGWAMTNPAIGIYDLTRDGFRARVVYRPLMGEGDITLRTPLGKVIKEVPLEYSWTAIACDHVNDPDGHYISLCCGRYALGEVTEDRKAGILPTGICGGCNDHAVFGIECATCGEIVEVGK